MNGGMADEALIDIEVHDLSYMIMASRASCFSYGWMHGHKCFCSY